MNQTLTSTAAITQSQLACLGGVSPSFITVHLDDLPESFFLRDGSNGRPPRCWTAEQIAELILDRTGFLTEAECRLRVALMNHESRRPRGTPRLIDEAGVCHVLPSDLRDISSDERELFRRARDADTARVHADRAKKRIATRPFNDTEE